ncbi:MAG TPA: CHRD domain-containing protein [Tepidisphaeraceae bacterium]|nr:CHRD domain-containing protein [Tepidisphaeraceae bacterium]
MRKLLAVAIVVFLSASVVSAAATAINVTMTGQAEPFSNGTLGAGDLGASGNASYTFDPDADTISWLVNYSGLQGSSLTGFHIHGPNATTTSINGVYRGFPVNPGAAPPSGTLSGTLTTSDDAALGSKIDTILANPGGFYVNIHTNIFPGGAIRAQLPEPATMAVLACAAIGWMMRRRRI